MKKANLKELAKELNEVLGKALPEEGKETERAFLLKTITSLFDASVSGRELKKALDEFVKIRKEDREHLLLLLEELRRLKPEKIEELKVHVLNPQKTVKVDNLKEIGPKDFPKEVGIKETSWLNKYISPLLKAVGDLPDKISKKTLRVQIEEPRDPKKAIAVRLSTGREFYNAITTAIAGAVGYPFKKDSGDGARGLVDEDGHVQVDVLSDPGSQASTTPAIYNITMTNADQEYSQVIPDGADRFSLQCQGNYDLRFAFVSGKVAAPTAPYGTVKAGMNYFEEGLNLTDKTIYVACGTAGQVAELIVWT